MELTPQNHQRAATFMQSDTSVQKVNQKIEAKQNKLRKDARMQAIKKKRLNYSLQANQE